MPVFIKQTDFIIAQKLAARKMFLLTENLPRILGAAVPLPQGNERSANPG